jgi:predicted O-methyltransferase YrrM
MAVTTILRSCINQHLQRFNLRLETLTAENLERKRLETLAEDGYFARPVFPVPRAFNRMAADEILKETVRYKTRFDDFEVPSQNDFAYTFQNGFYSSPDAEVLYTVIRKFHPTTIVEVGSGNSTKIIRQAARDGQFSARIISIDPHPRLEVAELADQVYRQPVEMLGNTEVFESLREGEILFIDSSHVIKAGSDVVFLYLNVLPLLAPGVLIHIHDIFLPFEYPREWVMEKHWDGNEQYLVQYLLMCGNSFEVLWAGYYLQQTRPDFASYFPHLNGRVASSLWLRKKDRGESRLSRSDFHN